VNKLDQLTVHKTTKIKEAMKQLSKNSMQILLVIDNDNKLIGTITDGDIRRGLLNGLNFGDNLEGVTHREFVSIQSHVADKKKRARELMVKTQLEHIPVVDGNNIVLDVIIWSDLFDKKEPEQSIKYSSQVVIMAGGKGARLDPFTRILPKPLIPIGETPIMEIIMETLFKCGFHNFIFTLNYKKEYIKLFLKENKFRYNVDWVEEDDYMGTAGSLSLLNGKVEEAFFVLNCDTILNADYSDIMKWHKEQNNLMTLVGCHREIKVPYGILELDRGVLKSFVEKPNYDVIINTGIYILEPEILRMIPSNKSMDMNTLIANVSKKGKVSVYPVHDGWLDVGQWKEYKKSLKEIGGTF
jgi:dTDP-glucose pyrophosphorylase